MTPTPTVTIDWTLYTIRYNRDNLWWEVRRTADNAMVLTGPTSGNLITDARTIEERMEALPSRSGSVTITPEQAGAACAALLMAVIASDITNANTWHGGLGSDGCEFCGALVVLRAAAGYTPTDHLRP